MRRKGTIAIPRKGFDGKYTVYSYEVTCFDQRDERGLDGGRIDHMIITKKGEMIAEYSGGWLMEPVNREAEIAASILIYEHN